MGTCQLQMGFVHLENGRPTGPLEDRETQKTKEIKQDIVREFAEHGHEVSFINNNTIEMEIESLDEVQEILNKIAKRHGFSLGTQEVDNFEDLNFDDFYNDGNNFGFDPPDFELN